MLREKRQTKCKSFRNYDWYDRIHESRFDHEKKHHSFANKSQEPQHENQLKHN